MGTEVLMMTQLGIKPKMELYSFFFNYFWKKLLHIFKYYNVVVIWHSIYIALILTGKVWHFDKATSDITLIKVFVLSPRMVYALYVCKAYQDLKQKHLICNNNIQIFTYKGWFHIVTDSVIQRTIEDFSWLGNWENTF